MYMRARALTLKHTRTHTHARAHTHTSRICSRAASISRGCTSGGSAAIAPTAADSALASAYAGCCVMGCARHEEGDHGAGAADADAEAGANEDTDVEEVEVEEDEEVGAAPLDGRDAMIVVVCLSSSPFEQTRAPGRAGRSVPPSDI